MTAASIEQWLAERLAVHLNVRPDQVNLDKPIDEYGLDSMEVVAITGELEDLLRVRIEPTLVWDLRTVRRLAASLASRAGGALPASTRGMSDDEVERMLAQLDQAQLDRAW